MRTAYDHMDTLNNKPGNYFMLARTHTDARFSALNSSKVVWISDI